jgi:hypothetical protein
MPPIHACYLRGLIVSVYVLAPNKFILLSSCILYIQKSVYISRAESVTSEV